MPVPPNITPETAIDITSLPFSTTQQVDDGAGNIYTVWYKFTPSETMEFGGLFSANGNFTALTQVFSPSNTQLHFGDPTIIDGASSAPFELPFNGGQTYYFKINNADYFGGDAILTIICLEFTTAFPIPAGSIAKNNDESLDVFKFPIIFADPNVDNTIIGFVQGPIPTGEHGDVLKTGVSLLANASDGTATLFSQNYSVISVIHLNTITDYTGLTSNSGQDRFWVTYVDKDTANANIISINPDGTTGVARDMGSPIDIVAIAVNAAETYLYYRVESDNHIKRWDLISNIDLGNFIDVGLPNLLTTELLCLVGGDIITGYSVSLTVASARAYNSSGTFVNEFQVPAHSAALIRLARGQDDTTTAWIMVGADPTHATPNIFYEFRISDFTQVKQFTNTPYNTGVWADITGFPPDPADFVRWGLSVSCPFWITRTDYSGPTAIIVVGKGSNPLAPGNFTVTGPNGTIVLTTDTYTQIPVAAGTYSIVETLQIAYLTQYYVSNDPVINDNTAVVVNDGDLIDVVIINLLSTDLGGLYQLTPGLKHDILRNQDGTTELKKISWFFELYTDRDK